MRHSPPSSSSRAARRRPEPIDSLLAPFREFASSSSAGGLVLLAAAILALVWANSPWSSTYTDLWATRVTVGVGTLTISASLLDWINDALMAVFFLLVGLEIKREVLVGELTAPRRAMLPIVAATGGALIPAILFLAAAGGGEASRGWGIPMATDIAFALGILALVGSRVPVGLRIFLTALAITDDLIAIAVIALFYTDQLNLLALAAAGLILLVLVGCNAAGVRLPVVYAGLGVLLWVAVYGSGIHATVAGVLLALTIPARTHLDSDAFVERARGLVDDFEARTAGGEDASTEHHHAALWELEDATERAQAPMLRMEHSLQAWVAFLIVPLFALANAGVVLPRDPIGALGDPITVGVLLGLVVGKQIGIFGAAFGTVRLGLASLPDGVTWRDIYGVAWLGGIGFTMSLFIGTLAFGEGSELTAAKLGILGASIVASLGGLVVLTLARGRPPESGS